MDPSISTPLLPYIALALLSSTSLLTAITATPLNPRDLLLHPNTSTPHGISMPLYSTPLSSAAHSKVPKSNRFPFWYNLNLMVEATMGTPPQRQKMVVDTGSELSWLQCINSFNPLLSASYAPIACSSPVCTKQTIDFPVPTACGGGGLCQYTYPYADGTAAHGNLAADTISFASLGGTQLQIPGFVFGCSILAPLPDTPGLMGLGHGALSFVSQMNGADKFSYCISGDPQSPGVLLFGDSPLSKYLRYTPLVTLSVPLPYFNRVAYSVRLRGIKVGKRRLPIPRDVFVPDHTGAGQTMVDSGTQFSFLLGQAYAPLREAFLEENRGVLNAVDNVFQALDLCFVQNGAGNFPQVSPVTLLFDSHAHIRLNSHHLLYQLPKGPIEDLPSIYCFTFANSDLVGVEANIIGNYHQQNLWVEYDLQNSRLGFARARCHVN